MAAKKWGFDRCLIIKQTQLIFFLIGFVLFTNLILKYHKYKHMVKYIFIFTKRKVSEIFSKKQKIAYENEFFVVA